MLQTRLQRALSLLVLVPWVGTAQTSSKENNSNASGLSEDEIRKALEADTRSNQQRQGTSAGQSPSDGGSQPGWMQSGIRAFQSLNPDLSFIADFALARFSQAMEMTGGHDPTENGFNLQALEMAVGASVDPYFRFDSNIVFTRQGVEIEEAYGTTLALPYGLQVRAGQFLTRFGRFNPTHPHTWTFSDQPLVLGRFFGADGNRNIGLEVSDLLTFLPWYVELVASATDARGETARSFFGQVASDQPQPSVHSLADFQYTTAVKQFFPLTDDLSLAWGLSGAFGPNSSGPGMRTEIYGTDVYLKYRPLTQGDPTIVSLHAELLQRRYHTPVAVFVDSGAFAHLFWRFALRWGAALSAEYVTAAEGQPLDGDKAGLHQRYKADVTFWPSEFSRLRLQYDFEPPNSVRNVPAHAVFLAVEFAIGAHGAHKF